MIIIIVERKRELNLNIAYKTENIEHEFIEITLMNSLIIMTISHHQMILAQTKHVTFYVVSYIF